MWKKDKIIGKGAMSDQVIIHAYMGMDYTCEISLFLT